MLRVLEWIIRKSVTLYWKKTHFHAYSWGVNEYVDLHVISEESMDYGHRFGTRKDYYDKR